MTTSAHEAVVVRVAPWETNQYRARCFTCGRWVGPDRDYPSRYQCLDDVKDHLAQEGTP